MYYYYYTVYFIYKIKCTLLDNGIKLEICIQIHIHSFDRSKKIIYILYIEKVFLFQSMLFQIDPK